MAPLIPLLAKILLPILANKVIEKVVQKEKESKVNETVAGLVRHALTALGGVLVAKGYLEAGMVEEIAGAVVTLVGVVWSVVAKRRASY